MAFGQKSSSLRDNLTLRFRRLSSSIHQILNRRRSIYVPCPHRIPPIAPNASVDSYQSKMWTIEGYGTIDIKAVDEAKNIYPLFRVGANVMLLFPGKTVKYKEY